MVQVKLPTNLCERWKVLCRLIDLPFDTPVLRVSGELAARGHVVALKEVRLAQKAYLDG